VVADYTLSEDLIELVCADALQLRWSLLYCSCILLGVVCLVLFLQRLQQEHSAQMFSPTAIIQNCLE
jgi:hypothetical protein